MTDVFYLRYSLESIGGFTVGAVMSLGLQYILVKLGRWSRA